MVAFDPSPYGHQLRVEVGVCVVRLTIGVTCAIPSECHVLLDMSNLPLEPDPEFWDARFDDFRSQVVYTLNLRSPLPDDERRRSAARLIKQFSGFVGSVSSEAALGSAIQDGTLKSASIAPIVKNALFES
jgi:hypothetical protein